MSVSYEYVKCQRCLGVGKKMGLGNIYRDCLDCSAVGFIKQEKIDNEMEYLAEVQKQESVEQDEDDNQAEIEQLPKRRGRRPKVLVEESRL